MRKCMECGFDLTRAHKNRIFCSTPCQNKNRYKRTGQRSTPKSRAKWYKNRCKKKGYREKLRGQANGRKRKVLEFLKNYKLMYGCIDCGYKKHHSALDFDHIVGRKKLNVCLAKSIKQAETEMKKCEVVCANCHRIRTFNKFHKPDIFAETYETVEGE